ncbi:MAG: hypothetical protein LBT71_08065 [Azoarcus sp.]|jgi:hypothetical protein|nr:hypothetical protein [Azoarcus sp.]
MTYFIDRASSPAFLRRSPLFYAIAGFLSCLALAARAEDHVTNGLDDGTPGALREVLSGTTETGVAIDNGVTVEIIGGAITPSTSVTMLQGRGGPLTAASDLRNIANAFRAANPDPATWGTYFASGYVFAGAVDAAVADALSTSGASVIQGNSTTRTAPVILDTRGGASSLGYAGLIFRGFVNALGHNCYTSNFCGGGIVGSNAFGADSTLGSIANSIFTGNTITGDNDYFYGGGVVGAFSDSGNSSVGNIWRSLFTGNTITVTNGFIMGGGVAGATIVAGTSGDSSGVGNISQSLFTDNTITVTNGFIMGGGVVGANSNIVSRIGDISQSLFTGNTVMPAIILGGGVVGAFGIDSNSVGNILQSLFTGNAITTDDNIHGGGVVGVISDYGSSVGDISESLFTDNIITAEHDNITGGGVVGTYSYYGGSSVGNISESHFTGNTVTADGYLYGGGVVGAYSNSGDSGVGDIFKGSFTDNTVKVNGSYGYLVGGGVVGAYSDYGSSSSVGVILESHFTGNTVTMDNNLWGGGVVGAYSESGDSGVGNISESSFTDNAIAIGQLFGGGVVGAYSDYGNSGVGDVSQSFFTGNVITTDGNLFGGGVVGAYSDYIGSGSSVGNILESRFTDNTVMLKGYYNYIAGGGVVGAYSDYGSSGVGDISESSFTDNTITAGRYIQGGGVVGAYSGYGSSSVGDISESSFADNVITAANIIGGGVVGAYSDYGSSSVGDISESLFTDNTITVSYEIVGGGVVGVDNSSGGGSSVGNISQSSFADNTITAASIIGGGVVGAYSDDSAIATVGSITRSRFTDNTIDATSGDLYGGLIYTADDLTIADSTFTDNTFTAGGTFGGTVSIDTSTAGASGGDPDTHTVTLQATSGQTTLFQNNVATDASGTTPNSLAFVNLHNGASAANAVLNIDAASGGTVALYDPIKAVLDTNHTFNMNVTGAGDFLWGGKNLVDTEAKTGAITLKAGTTTLLTNFELDAPTHTVAVNSAATLSFEGVGTLKVDHVAVDTGGTLNARKGSRIEGDLFADAGANLRFLLNNQIGNGSTILTVTGDATIDNARILIGFEASNPIFGVGDVITLIDAGALSADGINPTASATGVQGVSLIYNFDVLVDPSDATNLIATLGSTSRSGGGATPVSLNPQTKALAEGYLAGVGALLGGADLAEQGILLAAEASRLSPGPQVFGTVSGGRQRLKSGSHIDVDGIRLITGANSAQEWASGRSVLGAFFEYGEGHYTTHNSFVDAAPVKGKGDADYAGVGVLGRFDFTGSETGHSYLEGTLRTGRMETDFRSADMKDAWGRGVRFKSKTSYYGASLGAGYVWQVSERANLTGYGKYLWTHEGSDSLHLSTGDPVEFSAVNSSRLRLGARYNRSIGEGKTAIAYAGLAWEHEFDGEAKAKVYGYPIDAPKLKGDSGIAEIGVTLNPAAHPPLTLDLGVQGYAGKREGVTGTFRVNYKF